MQDFKEFLGMVYLGHLIDYPEYRDPINLAQAIGLAITNPLSRFRFFVGAAEDIESHVGPWPSADDLIGRALESPYTYLGPTELWGVYMQR
jgi:hypothetical protein